MIHLCYGLTFLDCATINYMVYISILYSICIVGITFFNGATINNTLITFYRQFFNGATVNYTILEQQPRAFWLNELGTNI